MKGKEINSKKEESNRNGYTYDHKLWSNLCSEYKFLEEEVDGGLLIVALIWLVVSKNEKES